MPSFAFRNERGEVALIWPNGGNKDLDFGEDPATKRRYFLSLLLRSYYSVGLVRNQFCPSFKKINPDITKEYFNKKASFLARLGSGSACRSIEGELIVWGNHKEIEGSSNLFGVKFPYEIHTNFKNYHDTILLVDEGEKQVSSTVGHKLMYDHLFADKRFKQANNHLGELVEVLKNGDLDSFVRIVESEALSLHAMMMTSNPYFILMKPNTLKIIHQIWAFREKTGSKICFTLDAGANVHVLYPENEKVDVNNFVVNKLIKYCQENHYICDRVGNGAKLVSNY